jgi:hypothetical protein
VAHGVVAGKELAAVRERIRRHVQNSHDQRTRTQLEFAAPQAPPVRRPDHVAIV